jgi:hypothetical protein
MARKQTRRVVDIHRDTYDRMVRHRELTGEPMSALVERLLEPLLRDAVKREVEP